MLKLRDYQAEAIAEVRRQWESGSSLYGDLLPDV